MTKFSATARVCALVGLLAPTGSWAQSKEQASQGGSHGQAGISAPKAGEAHDTQGHPETRGATDCGREDNREGIQPKNPQAKSAATNVPKCKPPARGQTPYSTTTNTQTGQTRRNPGPAQGAMGEGAAP